KIIEGAVAFSNSRDRVEQRIEAINANATIDAGRNLKLAGTARTGDTPLKFAVDATLPAPPLDRQTMPIAVNFEAPGMLHPPLSAKAEVRFNGSLVMMNSLTGALGDGSFNGWASVDLGSKPLVKLDLDFQRLDLAGQKPATSSAAQGWSDAPINLTA